MKIFLAGNFDSYEVEDDVLEHLQEFAFANSIYWGLVEGHAAEMASKRSAMENATKNAGEIIEKLTMTYNRGRQAAITNELGKYRNDYLSALLFINSKIDAKFSLMPI